jgi:hypothetical protein
VYADGRVISLGEEDVKFSDVGIVERRLTPAGVDLVRSGAVDPSAFLGAPSLPQGAWADPEVKPYAPSRYAVCYGGALPSQGSIIRRNECRGATSGIGQAAAPWQGTDVQQLRNRPDRARQPPHPPAPSHSASDRMLRGDRRGGSRPLRDPQCRRVARPASGRNDPRRRDRDVALRDPPARGAGLVGFRVTHNASTQYR